MVINASNVVAATKLLLTLQLSDIEQIFLADAYYFINSLLSAWQAYYKVMRYPEKKGSTQVCFNKVDILVETANALFSILTPEAKEKIRKALA